MARIFHFASAAIALLLLAHGASAMLPDDGAQAHPSNQRPDDSFAPPDLASALFQPGTPSAPSIRAFAAQQGGNASCTDASMAASTYAAAINASCGATWPASLELFYRFQAGSTAVRDAVDGLCASSCQAAISAYLHAYASCGSTATMVNLTGTTMLCQHQGGDTCANQMHVVATNGNCEGLNATQCAGRSSWCEWRSLSTGSQCASKWTAAALQQACTPCLDVLLNFRLLQNPISAERKLLLRLSSRLQCAKVQNTFCYPIFDSVPFMLRAMAVTSGNTMSIAEVEGNTSNTCTPVGATCINKVTALAVEIAKVSAAMEARNCVSLGSTSRSACFTSYKNTLSQVRRDAWTYFTMCAKGAGPNQDQFCNPTIHRWYRNDCRYSSCTSECVERGVRLANDMGCCATYAAEALGTAVPRSTVPIEFRDELSYNFVEQNEHMNHRHNVSYYVLTYCSARDTYNAAEADAALARTLSKCPGARVSRSMQLRGLRWSVISGNATLRTTLTESLRADIALAAGVVIESVNATLVEDTTQALTVSRRQATAGTKVEYTIDTDSTATASLIASEVDAAANSGALRIDTAAVVLEEECTNCVGSPTAAPGETPAPPPTGNFGSSLAGPSSGPPVDGSPARALSTATAVVAAIFVGVAVAFA